MTHIVERLRLLAAVDNCQASLETWVSAYHAEYYENERLRAALKEILNLPYGSEDYCRVIARATLGFTPVPDGQTAPGKEEV